MPKLGLIGYPLGHSFSPSYFSKKFEKEHIEGWVYDAYPIPSIEDFLQLWEKEAELLGLNVTIPYKEQVISYLDDLDESAEGVGAVNTIKKINNKLIGFNTDVFGFKHSLLLMLDEELPKKALILGTGGASKAVAEALRQLNISFDFVSRSHKKAKYTYPQLDEEIIKEHHLIINTTPLGTHPNTHECPDIPYQHMNPQHFLYDLVYNPAKTLFLERGEQQGTKTQNGLDMLHLQAEKAWSIWTAS